jgi:putative transposase
MTATLDDVAKKKEPVPEPAELQVARELVRQAKEQGLSLTGPGGLLRQLTKTVLETALDEELTEHLGYAKHAPASGGNVRNVEGAITRCGSTRSVPPERNTSA